MIVLGVEKNADDKAIKAAFRKLAMTNHPDRNQGDNAAEDRFREANEAYDILKDPQKRAAYDRMGHAAFDQSTGWRRWFWRRRLFRYFRSDVFRVFWRRWWATAKSGRQRSSL
jgi:molecular chaperone DnaJ